LKTFTDTHAKLGLTGFPQGMTLVTPACKITRLFEYGGDYTTTHTVPSLATANERFYDGRGNLVETIDYGRVDVQTPGDMAQPRIDVTFTDDTGTGADGRIVTMAQYEHLRQGSWQDVPVLTNTAGFCTRDFATGDRQTTRTRILEAKAIDYDSLNRPIRETTSLNTGPDPVTEYGYDAHGNRTRILDPRGNETVTAYDPVYHTFAYRVTNALGHVEEYITDPGSGQILSHTDANGHTRSAEYDGLGRIIARRNATGDMVNSYEYGFWERAPSSGGATFSPNRVRTIIHTPTGSIGSEEHHDGLARHYQTLTLGQRGVWDPMRIVAEFNDREIGWKQSCPHWVSEAGAEHWTVTLLETDSVTTPMAATGLWARMGLDRPVRVFRELDQGQTSFESVVYETPLSRKLIDARGNKRRETKDAFGNIIAVWEPNGTGSVGSYEVPKGQLTRYGYDALGRLEFVRRHINADALHTSDAVTRTTYDTLGRKVHSDDPDSGVSIYGYDANGNLIRSVDARGAEIIGSYDPLNRLASITFPDVTNGATLKHAYKYDTGTGTNLVGRLSSVSSPNCVISYSYDDEGRIAGVNRRIENVDYLTTTQHDYAGRETMKVYPDGMRLLYTYDPTTQALDQISDPDSGQVWLADVAMSKFGTVAAFALGNGTVRTNTFDYVGRATRLLTRSGTASLSDLRYDFDPNSNILGIRELAGPIPLGDMHYDYDALDRLTAAWGRTMSGMDAGTAGNPAFQYDYDTLGRMAFNSRFWEPTYSGYALEYEYSASRSSGYPTHGVIGIRFTKAGSPPIDAHRFEYDAAGHLVRSTNEVGAKTANDLSRTYLWDALGRPVSIQQGTKTVSLQYDHTRNRMKKTGGNGDWVVYVGDIMEVTKSGITKYVFAGKQRIATIKPNDETLFYMSDHLRSSTLVTDAGGIVVQRMDYEPYGAPIENSRSGNPSVLRHTYTGQEADFETGLMYYRARYYDPVVGMFISPDRFVASSFDPQAFNRYAYARNNPMRYVDETGEAFWLIFGIVIGALIGATMTFAMNYDAIMSGELSGLEIFTLLSVGAFAGALGGAAGYAAGAGASAAIGSALGAVAKGAIAGAIGGFAGGFTAGFVGGAIEAGAFGGLSFGEALLTGLAMGAIEGAIGAAAGGLGGAIGGKLGGKLGSFTKGGSNAVKKATEQLSDLFTEVTTLFLVEPVFAVPIGLAMQDFQAFESESNGQPFRGAGTSGVGQSRPTTTGSSSGTMARGRGEQDSEDGEGKTKRASRGRKTPDRAR